MKFGEKLRANESGFGDAGAGSHQGPRLIVIFCTLYPKYENFLLELTFKKLKRKAINSLRESSDFSL